MEAQNGPLIYLVCKTTSYFGDPLTQNKLVQTVGPFITKALREIRVISGSSNNIQNTAHVQYVRSARSVLLYDCRDLWYEHESLYKQLIFESMGCNTFEIDDYLRTPKTAHRLAAAHADTGPALLSVGSLQMGGLGLRSGGGVWITTPLAQPGQ